MARVRLGDLEHAFAGGVEAGHHEAPAVLQQGAQLCFVVVLDGEEDEDDENDEEEKKKKEEEKERKIK